MYLLDTNVVSETRMFGRGGDRRVECWAKSIPEKEFYLSAITVMELEIGVRRKMSKDRVQGQRLEDWLHGTVMPTFAGRVIGFDLEAAVTCAGLYAGATPAYRDAQIAATALAHGLTIVTRNVKDFVAMGVRVLNPWEWSGGDEVGS